MGYNFNYPESFKNSRIKPNLDNFLIWDNSRNRTISSIPAPEETIMNLGFELPVTDVTHTAENLSIIPESNVNSSGYVSNNSPYTNGIFDSNKAEQIKNKRNIWSYAGQGLGYLLDNADNIAKISNGVLGWMNYAQNKKLIDKGIEATNEQIAASKEYRQQRRNEIARLNRVRSNTSKAFNTGSVITRSY